jgi:hypothetical protein
MIGDYDDAVIPAFSDDEVPEEYGLKVIKLDVSSKCSFAESVVIAAKPSSIAISHLVDSVQSQPIRCDGVVVGTMSQSTTKCYVILEREVFFDVHDICDNFKEIVVLGSRQGPADDVGVLSTVTEDPVLKGVKQVTSGISGMAAHMATTARTNGFKCTIFLNEHLSIRVTLESLYCLSETVCKALNLPAPKADVLSSQFKKIVPINSRVPLYT